MRTLKYTLIFAILALLLMDQSCAQRWFRRTYNRARERLRSGYNFARQAAQGTRDMYRAYSDMREANWRNSDKYFHARGNYDAARRGPGGRWAARVISDAREGYQSSLSGQGPLDTARDQEANRWGRNGGDPNRYRPDGLPDRY